MCYSSRGCKEARHDLATEKQQTTCEFDTARDEVAGRDGNEWTGGLTPIHGVATGHPSSLY